jgi:voltage-gated potassium channel
LRQKHRQANGSIYFHKETQNGFTSIPLSDYRAIVTLTTVGYGDISPQTKTGQIVAAFIIIFGYCIIAVVTGIVTVELFRVSRKKATRSCRLCSAEDCANETRICKYCGAELEYFHF